MCTKSCRETTVQKLIRVGLENVSKEAPDAIAGGLNSIASLFLRFFEERFLNATHVEATLIGCARDMENGRKLGERVVSLADEQTNGEEANDIDVKGSNVN